MDFGRFLDKLREASFAGLVALVIAILVPVIFHGFRDRLSHYPQADLWGGVTLYAMVICFDIVLSRFDRGSGARRLSIISSQVTYVLGIIFFVIFTFTQRVPAHGNITALPIYLALAWLGLGLLVRVRVGDSPGATVNESGGTGLATTSVLISRISGQPNFILILNRNLNNGKGLWVPPGGHFELGIDNPADRLLQKIRSEVGVEAVIWQEGTPSADLIYSFNTAQTQWLTAPIFILDEDLLGLCSHGHSRHFDLIYVCEAVHYIPNAVIKYSVADQVEVPVNDCASSAEAAETAVYAAIEHWQRSTAGTVPGVRDTVSRDVPQRLHLVAVKYMDYLAHRAHGTVTGQS